MVLGQLDNHMQKKNEFGPQLHTLYKTNSKLIKDLNVRIKSIKLQEENMGVNRYDLELDNIFFLDRTPKA